MHRATLNFWKKYLDPSDPLIGILMLNLAETLRELDKLEEAF